MLESFILCEAKSTAVEASRVLLAGSAAPLTIFEATGFNTHATATLYWQLFAAAAAPAVGSVPIYVCQVPALQSFSWVPLGGFKISAYGIWVASTTAATYTAGTANLWALVKFLPSMTSNAG